MKSKFIILGISFLLINNSINAQQNFWEPANGPYGDMISAIGVNSHNQLFASNFYGNRMYFSSNGGDNWIISNNGLPTNYFYGIVVDQDDYVFTGTYSGLYRSTDNGINWYNVFDKKITSICLDENDFIYASTYYSTYFGLLSRLYRSTDKGITWQVLLYGDIDNRFTDVVINPNGHIFVCTFRGIYRSLNNGSTWTLIETFEPMFLAFQSNGIIYGGGLRGEGIYRSSDNGNSWEEINSGIDTSYMYISTISINTSDEIFIGLTAWSPTSLFPQIGKNYRSTDNGNSWVPIDNGLMNCAIHTIEFDTLGNIFGGTAIGVFSSDDSGNNWIKKNDGLRRINFISMCSDRNNNFFGVVHRDPTFYISSDDGLNWEIFNNNFPFTETYSTAINQSDQIFAGIFDEGTSSYYGICRSTDNGQNWEVVYQDLYYPINEIKIKQNSDLFAISLDGIFRSTNNGDNWNEVSSINYFRSIDFNQHGHIFAGNSSSGVYRSTDNGDSWIQINNGLNDIRIYSISVNHNGDIFAGSYRAGIFISTDNGDSWHTANTGLSTSAGINSIVVNVNNYLYAATNGNGVYWSTNNGGNWMELNSGMTGTEVLKLSINLDGYIVASTDHGIFKSINTTTDVKTSSSNLPSTFVLHQNYPNPFNPTTTIKFTIPTSPLNPSPYKGEGNRERLITLKVYDVLGNEIATLVNEEKPAGSYEVEFNGNGLTSGIYFYQLRSGKYIETRKMVLLR